jgi:putative transposase
VTQRGNNRQPVFFADHDRRLYLHLLTRHARRRGTRILSYCLMTNHVHLVAVPEREDSLARTFGPAHSEYASALNISESRTGHLWQSRFFSCPLDAAHLQNAMRYVELNPVRAKLVAAPWVWPWSSARAHCSDAVSDLVLDYCGGHRGVWDCMDWRKELLSGLSDDEMQAVRHATRTGEPLGSREFLMRLERQAGKRLSVLPRGRPTNRPEKGTDAFSHADAFSAQKGTDAFSVHPLLNVP